MLRAKHLQEQAAAHRHTAREARLRRQQRIAERKRQVALRYEESDRQQDQAQNVFVRIIKPTKSLKYCLVTILRRQVMKSSRRLYQSLKKSCKLRRALQQSVSTLQKRLKQLKLTRRRKSRKSRSNNNNEIAMFLIITLK